MTTLFSDPKAADKAKPLADALRPDDFSSVFGQEHLLGDDGILSNLVNSGHIPSIILWGPPGCGKTTLAKIIAGKSGYYFEVVSAVTNGAQDLKKIFMAAKTRLADGKRTLLLVDEIHRFNKAQQDLFLPYLEDGTIILIGATTENPSFELNSALLSRSKVLVLNRLDHEALEKILLKAEDHFNRKLPLTGDARSALCNISDGDGRYLLNMCEEILSVRSKEILDTEGLVKFIHKRAPIYDKGSDSHYNLMSAFHKSLRGSDVDAALYWLGRMLNGGENPLYIIRRLVRFANEDIGLADPQAVTQALAAKDVYDFLGSPEGELAIAQATVYLATAPKSNAVYKAFNLCIKDTKKNGSLMPPKHILNAPTKLMKDQGYHEGYIYDHDTEDGFSGQNYFPEEMNRQSYYNPVMRGFEREIVKRLDYWNRLREKKQ